ncbi:Aerotolerance protein BatA [hydrothermal vent metagenome]|uniref:Aerotolerance protein BatA n=1 Tax=hydrothermal vent metagenome TaxID=652676 RepID=A0A3B0YT60_9ZZZZ
MSIEFAWPWLLIALPLPLLVGRLLPRAAPEPKPALLLPFQDVLAVVAAVGRAAADRTRLVLATLVWVLLVLAGARPQSVGEAIELPVNGRDLMLAVDLSGSMQAEDMLINKRPRSRLAAVKAVAGEFIERRQGDRLGLILFGDQPYLQTPLTFDTQTVQTQLDEAVLGLAGKRTAIGDAIGLATKRLRQQSQENRVLLLLTDGSNTTGQLDPIKAAELAARQQIRIHTIGIGASKADTLRRQQRATGQELDEDTLTAIAKATGGRFFRARNTDELQQIYTVIDAIEPVDKDLQVFRPIHELYRWPLAGAIFVTLLIVSMRLPHWQRLRRALLREARHV